MTGSIYEKYSQVLPLPAGAEPVKEETGGNSGGVVDTIKETATKINPFNLVDKAGNFALRAVVIIVATGLIMLGFYFMFQSNIKQVLKAVA